MLNCIDILISTIRFTMKKLLLIFFVLTISLYSDNDVYSETNVYNINQENSNNTYIDNSQVLSNNSFALFVIPVLSAKGSL